MNSMDENSGSCRFTLLIAVGLGLTAVPAVADSFLRTGAMPRARDSHTATLLLNDKVLVVGGSDGTNALASAALYDPITGAWTSTGGLVTSRSWHTATLLPNGQVLVVGGHSGSYLDD